MQHVTVKTLFCLLALFYVGDDVVSDFEPLTSFTSLFLRQTIASEKKKSFGLRAALRTIYNHPRELTTRSKDSFHTSNLVLKQV